MRREYMGTLETVYMPFKHYIITRFNVRLSFLSAKGADPNATRNKVDWLEHRLNLFEQYCLPSVKNQACSNFSWIIVIDADTPERYRNRLQQSLTVFDGRAHVIEPEGDFVAPFLAMAQALQSRETHLITTRLDADDALHRDYVKYVQQAFKYQKYVFLSFPKGFTFDESNRKLRVIDFPANQFPSLIEDFDAHSTSIYCGNHVLLKNHGPFIMLTQVLGWLQVVHGRNLYNTQWGDEANDVPTSKIPSALEAFGFLYVPPQSQLQI